MEEEVLLLLLLLLLSDNDRLADRAAWPPCAAYLHCETMNAFVLSASNILPVVHFPPRHAWWRRKIERETHILTEKWRQQIRQRNYLLLLLGRTLKALFIIALPCWWRKKCPGVFCRARQVTKLIWKQNMQKKSRQIVGLFCSVWSQKLSPVMPTQIPFLFPWKYNLLFQACRKVCT